MSRFKVLVLGLVCGFSQLSCSFNSNCGDDYRDSVITPTLAIPPDLVSRKEGKNLVLPGSKVGTDENTGRFVETGNLNTDTVVEK